MNCKSDISDFGLMVAATLLCFALKATGCGFVGMAICMIMLICNNKTDNTVK